MPTRWFAPAKLNLYLHVTGRRADGWHLLDSLVAFATIGDHLTVASASELVLEIDGPFAAALADPPQDNLVWRAATMLAARIGRRADVAIRLTKNLPVASGIGGGSSDAAACLKALAARWHVEDAVIMEIAARLGSDIPACVVARPVWLSERGERIDDAGAVPHSAVVLVNPGVAVPTASVYRGFRGPFSPASRFVIPRDVAQFAHLLAGRRNDLTDAAIALAPEIATVLQRLAASETCLLARMSGSGATCFAMFADEAAAETAALQLRQKYAGWWIATATLSSGPEPTA